MLIERPSRVHGKRWLLVVVLLVVVPAALAGCSSRLTDPSAYRATRNDWQLQTLIVADACPGDCFEPTMAVDGHGAIAVLPPTTAEILVSSDGGATFGRVSRPPALFPGQPTSGADDTLLSSPDGRLWYVTVVATAIPPGIAQGTSFPTLMGAQIASSNDSGRSWATNAIIGLPGNLDASATIPDRPWLGFDDDTIYVTMNVPPAGTFLARSDDGGRSFGRMHLAVPGTSATTGAAVGPSLPAIVDGTVHIAYGTDDGLVLATSIDRGNTFTVRPVLAGDEAAAGMVMYPNLLAAPTGLHLVWHQLAGPAWITRSADGGGTWTPALKLGTAGTCPAPWAVWAGSAVQAVWFGLVNDSGVSLRWSSVTSDADGLHTEGAVTLANVTIAPSRDACRGIPSANTDFVQAAVLADGFAVVYADANEALPRLATVRWAE